MELAESQPKLTTYQLPLDTIESLENKFTYHAPFGDQATRYEKIRDSCKQLAYTVVELTPSSIEQSLALTYLDMVMMQANAAIARNESHFNR
jgi:hypothetical protein